MVQANVVPLTAPDVYLDRTLANFTVTEASGRYSLSLETGAYYTIFAYLDVNGNARLDLDQFEPCGWFNGIGKQTDFLPVFVTSSGQANIDMTLYGAKP